MDDVKEIESERDCFFFIQFIDYKMITSVDKRVELKKYYLTTYSTNI